MVVNMIKDGQLTVKRYSNKRMRMDPVYIK